MTDYTIPMMIGMTLAFTLGAGLGGLWGIGKRTLISRIKI